MTQDLFASAEIPATRLVLADGAILLKGRAFNEASAFLQDISRIVQSAPFRRMQTPSGREMSIEMTNCGQVGWVSDRRGYRYLASDPQTGLNWPAMPESFKRLATMSAGESGFAGFTPDVCLINRYQVGTKLNLHQDKDEQDFSQPIVSVSFGLSGEFLLGGLTREAPVKSTMLEHGDVLVFGGPARSRFHGVRNVVPDDRISTRFIERINLTFRKAQR